MFNFIGSIIIIVCLSAAIFILARKIPEANADEEQLKIFNKEEKSFIPKKKIFGKSLEDWDIATNKFLEYWLRKINILVLKIENYLSRALARLAEQKKILIKKTQANGYNNASDYFSAKAGEKQKETSKEAAEN